MDNEPGTPTTQELLDMLGPQHPGVVRSQAFTQLFDRFDPDDFSDTAIARGLLRFAVTYNKASLPLLTLRDYFDTLEDYGSALLAQGCLEIQAGSYGDAAKHLNRAHDQNPDNVLVALAWVRALGGEHSYRAAESIIKETLNVVVAQNDPYGADNWYTEWLEQLGDQERYREGLAVAQQGKVLLDDMTAHSQQTVVELPSLRFCTEAAYCAHMLDDLDTAIHWDEEAVRREDVEAPQYRNLANMYLRRGWRIGKAFRLYRLAGKLDGHMASNMDHLASAMVHVALVGPLDVVNRVLDKLAPIPPPPTKTIIQPPSRKR